MTKDNHFDGQIFSQKFTKIHLVKLERKTEFSRNHALYTI